MKYITNLKKLREINKNMKPFIPVIFMFWLMIMFYLDKYHQSVI